MTRAVLILAIIGGLMGFFGGFMNLAAGACGSAALGVQTGTGQKSDAEANEDVHSLAVMSTKGIFASFFSVFALISGVIAGTSKSSKAAFIFSAFLIGFGIGATLLTNYFSGPILALAGVMGIFGARRIKT